MSSLSEKLFAAQKPMDIIPVGRVAIDFNPTDMNRPLSESEHFNKYLGGSPANIAVGMARLGRKCGFLAKVSDDQFGDFVTRFFQNEGIDCSHITRCRNGEKLGLTFTEILSPTESSILMYREGAADLMLHPSDVDEQYVASAKALLISGTALCTSPTREAALKALQFAKNNGVTVIFDADYRAYTWKNDDEIALYTALVGEKADVILGSREEFDRMERLLGTDGTDACSQKYWLGRGASLIVIKHGKDGSRAFSDLEGDYDVKPFPVKALKGFGGGDGYASALLHGLMAGRSLRDALEMGTASAAMLVASHACSRDMPTEAALLQFIQEKKAQYGDVVTPLK